MPTKNVYLKIVVLGECGVGKTALLAKCLINEFIEEHKPNSGAIFYPKVTQIKDKEILSHFWEIAGQECFQSQYNRFYRGADACILVYDVTNDETFHKIDEWKSKFLERSDTEYPEKFPFLLLGNKVDLDEQRSVDENTARNYAKDNNLIFYEISVKNGHNIEEAIRELSDKASEMDSTFVISHDDEKEKSNADLIQKRDGSSSEKEDNESLKRELEDCNIVIDLLKEENKRLSEQNAVYLEEQKEAQMRIDELENEIQELRLKALDLTKFMEWDWEMVHLWIMGLEDGKFKKYDAVLSKALSEAETEGEDLLEVSPSFIKFWGIKDRKDREGLNGYIKILVKEYGPKSKENEGFDTLLV